MDFYSTPQAVTGMLREIVLYFRFHTTTPNAEPPTKTLVWNWLPVSPGVLYSCLKDGAILRTLTLLFTGTSSHVAPHSIIMFDFTALAAGASSPGMFGVLNFLRAYPINPAQRYVMTAQARCRKARSFSTFFSQRIRIRRNRFSQLGNRPTTRRRARYPGTRGFDFRASPRRAMCGSSPNARAACSTAG
jgi:hypothetical protein